MSENNSNSESFDFDFDSLNAENQPENTGSSSSFDLGDPFADDPVVSGSEPEVSANNPYLSDSSANSVFEDSSMDESSEIGEGDVPPIADDEETKGKKKGLLGGLLGGKKKKAPKGKKEKVAKEKEPAGEPVPRDWGTILCIAFSLFLLASLLMFNIAAFATSGNSMMQTLCFLGAFNLIGLAAAAVPILFYKFPKERTLPNVMLGIAAVATCTSLLIAVTEFYRYSFILKP